MRYYSRPSPMMAIKPAFDHLEAAYQLHFYFCFKTHYLRPLFADEQVQALITSGVEDVRGRHGYHLLEIQLSIDHIRVLLSLKPDQTVSRAVQMLKDNLSRQFSVDFSALLSRHHMKTPWAEGYLARSSGKADLADGSQIRREPGLPSRIPWALGRGA